MHHYFGTKRALLEASIALPFEPAQVIGVLAGDDPDLGEFVTRVLSVWDNPVARQKLTANIRVAIASEEGADQLRDLFATNLMEPVRAMMDGPDADLRTVLAASHLAGLALLRYLIPVEPLASLDTATVAAALAPALEQYLDPRSTASD